MGILKASYISEEAFDTWFFSCTWTEWPSWRRSTLRIYKGVCFNVPCWWSNAAWLKPPAEYRQLKITSSSAAIVGFRRKCQKVWQVGGPQPLLGSYIASPNTCSWDTHTLSPSPILPLSLALSLSRTQTCTVPVGDTVLAGELSECDVNEHRVHRSRPESGPGPGRSLLSSKTERAGKRTPVEHSVRCQRVCVYMWLTVWQKRRRTYASLLNSKKFLDPNTACSVIA